MKTDLNTPLGIVSRVRRWFRRRTYSRSLPALNRQIPFSELVIQASPSGIVLVDAQSPNMPIIFVNEAYERQTGYRAEEVIGQNPRFMQGNDRDQPAIRILRHAIENQESCIVVLRNYKKDGSLFWNELRISPVFSDEGKLTHYMGIQNNINARKMAEDALAKSEALYRQMFDHNQAMKLIINPQTGRIVDANPAAEMFYGYSLHQLKSMYISQINTLSEVEVYAEMQLALLTEKNFFQFQHELANGEVRDVEIYASPIDTTEGRLLYSIIVDVTEKKRAEVERETLVSHLRFLNQAALHLLTLPSEELIYEYMGGELINLLHGDAIVIVNQASPSGDTFLVQGIYGVDQTVLGKAISILGYSPVGQEFVTTPAMTSDISDGSLKLIAGGLVEFAKEIVPAIITRQLVRLFNLGELYLVALLKDDVFYAAIQIYLLKGQSLKYPELIETFLRQTSNALKHVQSKDDLQRSEARYRRLAENSHDLISLRNAEGEGVYVSPSVGEILGYSQEEFLNFADATALIHPEDVEATLGQIRQEIRSQPELSRVEYRLIRKDQEQIWVESFVTPIFGPSHEIEQILTVSRDITRRKFAEQELRQREAYLQSILTSMNTLVVRTDLDGNFTYVNAGMYENYLWMFESQEATIGVPSKVAVHPEDYQKADYTVQACIESPGTSLQVELRMPKQDGGYHYTLWEFMAVTGPKGMPIEIQCVGIDITDRILAEKRSFDLELEKERVSLLNSFIQNVAHEFRTPLTTINTNTFVMSRSEDSERRLVKAGTIEDQVKRINKLVDMLIMVVELESTDELELAPLQVEQVIHEICKNLQALHGERPTLHYEKDLILPEVQGHAFYLTQAFRNVLENAYRYTPERGEISIEVTVHDEYLSFEIRDTGIGIAEQNLPHIFEKFWREDTAHSTPGLGLGLPIAEKILSLHQGAIQVESELGRGSTFRLWLPIHAAEADA